MRTFPTELAKFRKMVNERGARLRQLPFSDLEQLDGAAQQIVVDSRKATIASTVLPLPSGGVQVVLQGFMEHRFMPGKSVALDGFYKYPDDTVAAMQPEDFYPFD